MYHFFVTFCVFLKILVRNSGFDFKKENQTKAKSSTLSFGLVFRQLKYLRNRQTSGKQRDAEITNVNN